MSKRLVSNGPLTKLALAVLFATDWMTTVAALNSSPTDCQGYRRHSPKTCGVVPMVVYFVTDKSDQSLKKTQEQFFSHLHCLLNQTMIAFKKETIGDGDSTLCSLLDEKRRAALSELEKFGNRSLHGRVLVAFVHGKSFDRHNCDSSQLKSKLLNNDSFWRPAVVNTIHDDRRLPLDKLKAFFDYQNLTKPLANSFELAIFVCQIIRVGRESADRLEKSLADRQLLWAKLRRKASSSTTKRMEMTKRRARTTTATATTRTRTNATASIGEGDATRSSGSGPTTTDELRTIDDDEYKTRPRGSVAKEQKKQGVFPLWVTIVLVSVGLFMVLTLLSAVSLVVRREQGFARAKSYAAAGDEKKGAKKQSPAGQLLVKRPDFALVRRVEQQEQEEEEEEEEEETATDEQDETTNAVQDEAADADAASTTQSGRSERDADASVDSTKSPSSD